MTILGFDVKEWAGLFAMICSATAIFRIFIVKPLTSFIEKVVFDHIKPLTEAIDRNTDIMKAAKAEHKQIGKRLDTVESRVENHGERILRLEGSDKK